MICYGCISFQTDKRLSLDLDLVPKTKRLNNQIATSCPKLSHNPPSRVRTVVAPFSSCLS